jgi:hypothetical protein
MLFVSSIPPHHSSSLNLFASNSWQINSKLPPKVFIKNSYLILSWFYYLKLVTYDNVNKTKIKNKKKLIKFAVLPTKRTHLTLTKAPMAHKTNSKEQFLFKFYYTLATFKGLTDIGVSANSCDSAALALLTTSRLFPVFSTNILFLKNSRVMFSYHDLKFFSYYYFSTCSRLI